MDTPSDPQHLQYGEHRLREIGKQCGKSLPPASTVQAMFLYEMQRQSEQERLFQGQLFRFARAEDETKAQNERISKIENGIKTLQKQATDNDLRERLATSKVNIDRLQAQIKELNVKDEARNTTLRQVEEKTQTLQQTLDRQREDSERESHEPSKPEKELDTLIADLKTNFETVSDDVTILFDDRDAIVAEIKEVTVLKTKLEAENNDLRADMKDVLSRLTTIEAKTNDRVKKLEDNVRALTAQRSLSPSSSPTILMPVQTTNGQTLELSVPKGSALPPHKKENRGPVRG